MHLDYVGFAEAVQVYGKRLEKSKFLGKLK